MALIKGKMLEDGAIDGSKIKLNNNEYLLARNAADSADVGLIKANASDQVEFSSDPYVGANKVLTEGDKGIANGVCPLGADGRVPSANLTSDAFEYKGTFNPATSTPPLANGSGTTGDTYKAIATSSYDFGAGAEDVTIGDRVVYNGTTWDVLNTADLSEYDTDDLSEGAVNFYYTEARFDASLATKTTDDLTEGASNLYFTEQRVQDTVIADYTVGADAPLANTDSVVGALGKVQGQINALAGATSTSTEYFTLDATDIGNQFVTLANTPNGAFISVQYEGVAQFTGEDFSTTGPQFDFAGDIAALAAIGDKLIVSYTY